ncbi:MAG: ATP-binding protein [Chitinophagales bacterium]
MKLDQSTWDTTEDNVIEAVSFNDNHNVVQYKKNNALKTIELLKSKLESKNLEINQLKNQIKENKITINDIQQTKQNLFENIYAIENLEREKIAYVLHEGIGQDLASIRYMLKDTIDRLEAKNISSYNLNEIHNMLANTIVEVKNVTYKIIPADISKFGFIRSLESMIEDLNDNFPSTKFTFYSNLKEEIPSINDQLSIYRIIQECINNIIKHAQASEAGIQITCNHNSLLITIEDNGIGFNYHSKSKNSSSRGLQNIISRSKVLNADLLVDSKPNRGTCIHLLLNDSTCNLTE